MKPGEGSVSLLGVPAAAGPDKPNHANWLEHALSRVLSRPYFIPAPDLVKTKTTSTLAKGKHSTSSMMKQNLRA
jgi:hypothetical protein